MISDPIRHTCKQRWFSFIAIVAATLLPMIATLNSTSVQAAQALSSSLTITDTAQLSAQSSASPFEVAMVVFFTRPQACAQDSHNCQSNVQTYAPDSTMSCSSAISMAVDGSAAAWTSNGKECPYLTCNYLSMTSCNTQSTKTVFRPLAQPIPNVGDSYMLQLLKFSGSDVKPTGDLMLSGCIYYANWPEMPSQSTQLAFSWPGLKLLSKTPVPAGVNMQKILTGTVGSTKGVLDPGEGTGDTGWNVHP